MNSNHFISYFTVTILFLIDLHLASDFDFIIPHLIKCENNERKLSIKFDAFGNQTFHIDLIRNYLIPENNYYELPKNNRSVNKHCFYKGKFFIGNEEKRQHTKQQLSSFAAISYCDNKLNGILTSSDINHYYQLEQTNSNYVKIMKMKDYPSTIPSLASLLSANTYHCGFNDDKPSISDVHSQFRQERSRREALNTRKYSHIFQQQRYVELVLVNDLKSYEKYKGKLSLLYERNIQIANIVNALYSEFNISIVLVGVVVWMKQNEIHISNNSSETLNNFLRYRRDYLLNQIPNDNAQLITATPFENGIVGKALKQTMCTYEYSGGVNYDYHNSIYLIATTIAHELGHNFGMEHDNENCHCEANNCIMGPSSSFPHPRHWSSCSVSQLEKSLAHGLDYCLMNKPTKIFKSSCGNGIIDDGEECDCGLPNFCTNKCCNATTCKLADFASCSNGDCCNLNTCQLIDKYSNHVCRHSKSICDPPEICDGRTENCPTDQFTLDGTECNEGYAYCFDGKCETRENRCHLLWGNESQVSNYRCYENNANANSSGNCGYNKKTKTFIPCRSKEDIICGRLHCTNSNMNNNRKLTLRYGPEGSTVISQIFESSHKHDSVITCFSVIVDLGLYEHDVGLVPDGAKCGNDKMCINQKCVPVKQYQDTHCDRHPDHTDHCRSAQSTSKLIFTYLIYIIFSSLPIILIVWYYFKNNKRKLCPSVSFLTNWFGHKKFIAKDYNNRRQLMNPIKRSDISAPLGTELNRIRPVRPAPLPPSSNRNSGRTESTSINVNGNVKQNADSLSNHVRRPKKSPPPPPPNSAPLFKGEQSSLPPPQPPSSSQIPSSPKTVNKVKDIIAAFERD